MLKKLAIIGTLSLSLTSLFAQDTIEQAQSLFSLRGVNVQNAVDAADIYARMAETVSENSSLANLKISEAQAIYYVGTQAKEDNDKKPLFNRGMESATKAIAAVGEDTTNMDEATKEILAKGYYQYGANLGKWAEANGIASSLGKWPELERTMKKVIALKKESIEKFGALRILGRAYYKLPAPLGSNKKATIFLEKAFNETKEGNDISVHGLNNLYLADLYIATDRPDDAKTILESFIKKDPETFNPARIPETKVEIEEAKAKLQDLE